MDIENKKADNIDSEIVDHFYEQEDNTELTASPTENTSDIDETKRYAIRLNKEREKIRSEVRPELENEVRNNIAKDFGYDSWEEYLNAQTDNKLIEQGLNPDQVKPIINDLLERDPRYITAMKFKEQQEKAETDKWVNSEIEKLNKELGLNLKSVNDLDEDTVNLWSSGVNLKNAYIANHYDEIQNMIIKKTSEKLTGKEHLSKIETVGNSVNTKPISDDTRNTFFKLYPNATETKYKEYLKFREEI